MNDTRVKTLNRIRQFLERIGVVELVIEAREGRHVWIQQTLIRWL